MLNSLTPEQQEIKAYFIAERGYWRPWTETILRINPDFLRRYATYAGYPARTGPLSQRMIELIYIALDASSTHLFASGVRTHLDMAMKAGATPQDVLDVLHLVATQGLEAVYAGVTILAEEAGLPATCHLPSEQRARVEAIFPENAPYVAALAQLDPGYLEALLGFLEYGDPMEGLMASERVLIEIALNACFTGRNEASLRRLIRIALDAGVDRAEILQVIQLGAHLSVHGTALGATLLEEHLNGSQAVAQQFSQAQPADRRKG